MIMMPYGWTLAIAAAHRSGGLLAPHRDWQAYKRTYRGSQSAA